ncbi:hypothetical protein FRC03_003961 [Tulasnella sp. 419]|nr:hypothetical protein FRC03_003961 [Tulasnella sp. 419]
MSRRLSRDPTVQKTIDGVKNISLSDNTSTPVRTTTNKQLPNSNKSVNGGQAVAELRVRQTGMNQKREQPASGGGRDYKQVKGDTRSEESDDDEDKDEDDDEGEDTDNDSEDTNELRDTARLSSSITAPIAPSPSGITNRSTTDQSTIFLPRIPFLKFSKLQEKRKSVDRLSTGQWQTILEKLAGVLGVKTCDVTHEQRVVAFRVAKVELEGRMMKSLFDASFSEAQRQNFISRINLTIDQTAEILVRTASQLRKPYQQLSPKEKDEAINQKKIEILMSVPATGGISARFETAITEQIKAWNEENDRVLANAAVSLGKPVGKLSDIQKEKARQKEQAEICARLKQTYRIPVEFPERVDLTWRLPPHVGEHRKGKVQETKKIREVHLSAIDIANALKIQARELKKPVDQLTKAERRTALKNRREQASAQRRSAAEGPKDKLKPSKTRQVDWDELMYESS